MVRTNTEIHQGVRIQDQYFKSQLHLYTYDKQSKNKAKKNNYIYSSIRINYLGIKCRLYTPKIKKHC